MKVRAATLQLSMASARLKFGISGTRRKSRTDRRKRRSQPLPIVPARISAPQSRSPLPADFRPRNAAAITGAAARETQPQARDGNSPPAMPAFVVGWIASRPWISGVVTPRE